MCNPLAEMGTKLGGLPSLLMKKNKLRPKDIASGGATLFIGGDKYKNRTVNAAAPTTTPAVSRTNQYGITDNLL